MRFHQCRTGLALWNLEAELHTGYPGQSAEGDASGIDPYFGVGAEYAVNKSIFGLEYTLSNYTGIDLDGDFTVVPELDLDLDVVALMFAYSF